MRDQYVRYARAGATIAVGRVGGKSGVGASHALVDTRQPDQHVREHYLNVGASYWVEDSFAIGPRAAVFAQQIAGEMQTTGARSVFMTARLVLP